ncbi:MAG TPA: malto-oligosyltrehalose synthase [Streptosporangiaceae bacterium]
MFDRRLSGRSSPVSTYRLQLRPGFGFADAAAVADYLADLGVTHVYLSPILQAAPGSTHGYDVADHSRISAELGGAAAFRAMAECFRHYGLGLIVDVVPNHMAIPAPETLNRQLWSVLAEGTGSVYARWFDVDWEEHGGRLLLPILAGPVEDCLGELAVDRSGGAPGQPGEAVLRYHDHVLPVRPGTADLPVRELAEAQHYLLAHWRVAATQLNWRRFFDITSLIGIRVEDAEVFDATHRLLLSLVADGLIDGLRVDHPDGLADPRGYLERLASRTGNAWVVTEKILTGTEEPPPDWRCVGTTGYDALGAVTGLFLDPAGAEPLTSVYTRFTGGERRFAPVAQNAKREAADRTFAAELSRLARLLARAGEPAVAELSARDVRTVLAELLAALGAYRAYVTPGEPAPKTSIELLDCAAASARGNLPARLHAALAAIRDLALGRAGPERDRPATDEFVVRFQQTCGPVMAKGVEDTAFYRWSRLVALNEVGGDPDRFGVSPQEFHRFAARLARDWPATMTTLSTHDTKRQEDVRARLAVLAEHPELWAAELAQWHERAAELGGAVAPELDTEYLLWQALIGAWPAGRERIAGYLRKAMREAKTATSWTDPDPWYESAVLGFAGLVLNDKYLTTAITRFLSRTREEARANSLGAKIVQLTMPGVADVYQGCELAGLSLVDPDNRRPVDFERRRRMLADLDAARRLPGSLDVDKLLVTSRALRLRRAHPGWYHGGYTPVWAEGPAAPHVIAFARGPQSAVTVATRLPGALRRAGGWGDTVLLLPDGRWRDVLTGARHDARPPLAALTRRLPVALLVPDEAGAGPGGDPPEPPGMTVPAPAGRACHD